MMIGRVLCWNGKCTPYRSKPLFAITKLLDKASSTWSLLLNYLVLWLQGGRIYAAEGLMRLETDKKLKFGQPLLT